MDTLQIGWAHADITPNGKVNLLGQFSMRITDKVRDPITITALSISTGNNPQDSLIMVSCDIVTVPTFIVDESRRRLSLKDPSFPAVNLIINATHTHTAPDIRPGFYDYSALTPQQAQDLIQPETYREFLIDKIVNTVLKSWNHRTPGHIAWGFGHAVVGRNRRATYLENFSQRPDFVETPGQKIETNGRMYGNTDDPLFSNIEGHEDHTVQFLYTFDQNKKLTGSIINIVCPSQETEGIYEISADFWHELRQNLYHKYGTDLFILPQCAAAGDQSPHLLYNKKAQERRLALLNIDSRQDIANRITKAFEDTVTWAQKDLRSHLPLKHIVRSLELSKRKITPEEYHQHQRWIEQHDDGTKPLAGRFLARCQEVIAKYQYQQDHPQDTLPVEIHVIKLGDIVFATNPFELFLDYGIRIQAQSPAQQTFIVQLASKGIPIGGSYLPTARAQQGGGYSACLYCNHVGHQGGQQLVIETLTTIKELWQDTDTIAN